MVESNTADWAYLAGLFDGEGSMSVYRNGPRMSISNTYKEVLEWVQDLTETGRIFQVVDRPQATRPCYQWDCGANGIRATMPKILPYLMIKRYKGELMLQYVNLVKREPKIADMVSPNDPRRLNLIAAIKAA